MAHYRPFPLFRVIDLHDVVPFDCVPVAIELIDGAQSLVDYEHPERAMYVFGPEDGTLGQKVLGWCRDVVYVPTARCMNLAATVNVVLYDRLAKLERRRDGEGDKIVEAADGSESVDDHVDATHERVDRERSLTVRLG
jgi:tRNA C32,U32 (ribose-2'-O)-methylase TrmJ